MKKKTEQHNHHIQIGLAEILDIIFQFFEYLKIIDSQLINPASFNLTADSISPSDQVTK